MSEWIPVTRELPDDDRYVLVSIRDFERPLVAYHGSFVNPMTGHEEYSGWLDAEDPEHVAYAGGEVTAWMELPEPYKPRCWDCVHCALGGDMLVCTNLDSDKVGETWADNTCERWNDNGKG